MSFTVPTLQEVLEQARARMRSEMPGTDASVWPNTNYVYSKIWAGEIWEVYQYLEWISRQRFATTADGDQLDAHGRQFNLSRKSASTSQGSLILSGLPGYTVPGGTIFSRSDDFDFETISDAVLDADGNGTVIVQAVSAGSESNSVSGTELASSDASISSAVVDDNGLGGGAAAEDDASYRTRILMRMRYPPHGGAAHDYVFWALETPGVSRVWVEGNAYGPGTVGVWFMTDDITVDGIPDAAALNSVRAYIESSRPITARVTVSAPIAATIDIQISGLGTPTASAQDLIEGELKDVFRRQVSVSLPSTQFVLKQNIIWQAVARATGDSIHTISVPGNDVVIPEGYVATLGSICYSQK